MPGPNMGLECLDFVWKYESKALDNNNQFMRIFNNLCMYKAQMGIIITFHEVIMGQLFANLFLKGLEVVFWFEAFLKGHLVSNFG